MTNTFARMGLHLLLLPVIVSLTYEFNRMVGAARQLAYPRC